MRIHHLSPLRSSRSLLAVLLLALVPVACQSKPAQPSEAYSQAHKRFSKLYAEKGDEAFADPAMDEVESLLGQVPADSLDAVPAQELRDRIKAGRAQLEAARKARQEAVAGARTPLATPPSSGEPERPPSPPPAAQPPDAGTPADSGPVVGTPVRELTGGFYGCFQKGAQVAVAERGMRDRWELSGSARCRQQYASLQDKIFIVEEDKVLAVLPRSSLEEITSTDGGR